jgi:hypothetical protein
MKVLLIGCGSIGKRHALNLLEIVPEAQFAMMNSNGLENDFAEKIGAKMLTKWDTIEDLDLVIVANPSAYHANHVEKIIVSNLPAYIEKPLVTSLNDLNNLKTLTNNHTHDKPIMMGCNLRFLPSIQLLKETIEKGKIGNICRAIFEVGQYLPDWRTHQDYRDSYSAKKNMGGGVVFDLVHELDLVRYLLGEFEVVSSQHQHLSHLEMDVEDTAVIHLGRKRGPLVSVHLDYVSRMPTRNIRIVGDEGTLIWDLINKKLELRDATGIHMLSEKPAEFDVANSYKTAMKELINAIENKQCTSQPLSEGILTTELMLQCKGAY